MPLTTGFVHTLGSVAEGRHDPRDGRDRTPPTAEAGRWQTRRHRADRAANDGERRICRRAATRVLRVKPGDRGEQFAADITADARQVFVAKGNGQVIGYGRVAPTQSRPYRPGVPGETRIPGLQVRNPAFCPQRYRDTRRSLPGEVTETRLPGS
jgi:hypothetical protein